MSWKTFRVSFTSPPRAHHQLPFILLFLGGFSPVVNMWFVHTTMCRSRIAPQTPTADSLQSEVHFLPSPTNRRTIHPSDRILDMIPVLSWNRLSGGYVVVVLSSLGVYYSAQENIPMPSVCRLQLDWGDIPTLLHPDLLLSYYCHFCRCIVSDEVLRPRRLLCNTWRMMWRRMQREETWSRFVSRVIQIYPLTYGLVCILIWCNKEGEWHDGLGMFSQKLIVYSYGIKLNRKIILISNFLIVTEL